MNRPAAFPVALTGSNDRVKMWASEAEVEHEALEQLRRVAQLPWVHGVRVMPDVHVGKGATIGSVIAMNQAVSPSAVGVDIGCGVAAVRTSIRADQLAGLELLRASIEAAIPVGFNAHEELPQLRRFGLEPGVDQLFGRFETLDEKVQKLKSKAIGQLGTLGGGNHFLELCLDQDDRVWITLHSGSRNIGKTLADRHIGIAKSLGHNQGLVDKELAVFIEGTPQMDAYKHDLWWAQEYAAASRALMLALFKEAVVRHFETLDVRFDAPINVHHNYVNEEMVDGQALLVTRKGAIRAGAGDLALIPGSMGTGSYVVRGRGNPGSYFSASHGAGRRMSRTAAKKMYSADDLAAQTAGIECRKDAGVVDEIPAAYKDIHQVIEAQKDLVEVVGHLRTILCVKG
ncbi:RtcB family protein [Glutamicibacter halophytocola]|uniref:3'-phosphate/5'-hydroxy nucleic acid ligase n=1 Tax=Glutamicibacter halophytocola TaxID=1933880 RepID=A0ABX5YEL0_9MICC|nr:RtcB family protein [Glutamicibacter halophytocola]NQD40462.1 RtcB family protein [Glutamicibacter halophytocola]QDY68100.1 RtcB family protein [Glutamicibacter halophytocola]